MHVRVILTLEQDSGTAAAYIIEQAVDLHFNGIDEWPDERARLVGLRAEGEKIAIPGQVHDGGAHFYYLQCPICNAIDDGHDCGVPV